jgi:nitroimidazol reductase NimA-like FMN-containing flavoprotein (pyridoxamine 5'-phosphate oxidase superfamily)
MRSTANAGTTTEPPRRITADVPCRALGRAGEEKCRTALCLLAVAEHHSDMATTKSHHVEIVNEPTCRALLRTADIGRLAVQGGAAPEVFPVNFGFDGESIFIRTGSGTKLGAARRMPATFEIDGIDAGMHTGWSVVAKGMLDEVTPDDVDAWRHASEVAPAPWAGGERTHVLRLRIRSISGRRILRSV